MALIDIDTYGSIAGGDPYRLPYNFNQPAAPDDTTYIPNSPPPPGPLDFNPFTLQPDTFYQQPAPAPQQYTSPFSLNPLTLEPDAGYSEPVGAPLLYDQVSPMALNPVTLEPEYPYSQPQPYNANPYSPQPYLQPYTQEYYGADTAQGMPMINQTWVEGPNTELTTPPAKPLDQFNPELGDGGNTLIDALNLLHAPVEYATGPAAAALFGGVTDSPLGYAASAALGGGIPGLLGKAAYDIGKGLITNYGGNKQAYEDFQQNEDVPWAVRTGVDIGLNPLTYATPALKGAGVLDDLSPIARMIVDQGSPLQQLGAGLGSEAAVRYGENVPYFGDQPKWLQGLEGGALGMLGPSALEHAPRAYTSLLGPEGKAVQAVEQVAPGFGGSVTEDVSHVLTKGATVIDDTGKEWEVARRFTGDENGKVRVKDPETGEVAAVERSRLSEPGAMETSPVAPTEARGAAESAGVSSPPAAPPPTVRVGAASADGAAIVPPGADLRLPRTASGDLVPPRKLPPAPSGDQPFGVAIMNHLRQEWYYRISGTAKRELSEGRSRQVRGIVSGAEEGASGTEAIARARAGARGKILSSTKPLELTPAQLDQANTAIVDAMREGTIRPFDVLQADDALKTMLAGDRPQPAQMRLIRKIFGDDIADLAVERPETMSSLERARRAQQAKDAEALVRAVERDKRAATAARLKENTDAQKAAADAFERLQAKAAKAKADAAASAERARRIQQARDAAALVENVEGAKSAVAKAREAKALADLKALGRVDTKRAQVVAAAQRDWEAAQARALKAANDADAAEIRAARAYQEAAAKRAETQAQRAATAENRADVRAAERHDNMSPNDEMLLKQAAAALGEQPNVSSALNREAINTIKTLLQANRAVLDGIGEAGQNRLKMVARTVRDAITGGVGDSYVNHLAVQEEIARSALEAAGVDPGLAKKVADLLTQRELTRRYGANVPERITNLLKKTGSPDYQDEAGTIARGSAAIGQRFKNTMFGPLDLGLPGVQGLKAATTSSVQLTAGIANRMAATMHLPHVDTMAGSTLSRRAQYAIDDVIHNVATGNTDVSREGTVLGWLGPVGRAIDKPVVGLIDMNNRLQFGLILGTMRDVIHEGNLVLARATGADISDPLVRQAAAHAANSATSAAHSAVSGSRALAEKGLLMTPSMRRAQVEQIAQVVKGFTHPANRAEFIISAATIASTGIGMMAVGKVLNDRYGLTDFEFDPSQPGFGRVTIPGPGGNAYSVDLFPQSQILKYTAQAVRALAEAKPAEARDALTKLAIGSSGPVPLMVEKGIGYGFDQTKGGYALGDFGEGMSPMERAMSVLPLPPVISDLLTGVKDKTEETAGVFGLNVNKDEYATRDANLKNDPAFNDPRDPQSLRKDPNKPATWDNLSPKGYQQAKDKYGIVDSRNPVVTANREAKAETEANRLKEERDAAALHDQDHNGLAFREQLSNIQRNAAIEKRKTDSIYQTFKDTGQLPPDPNDRALTQFYDLYDKARLPGGEIDWDKFDTLSAQLREGWTPAQAKYVDDQQGLATHDPAVQGFYDGRAKLDSSGFFDVKDDAWSYFVQQHPQLAEYKDYWDWRDKAQQWEYDQLIQQGVKPGVASQQAADNVSGLATATKFAEYSRTMFRHQWVVANPEQAVFAWEYGYFEPDKQEKAWLTENGYTLAKTP